MNGRLNITTLAATLALSLSGAGIAGPREEQLDKYASAAKAANPGFSRFSAERGKALYFREVLRDDKTMSCTTCHSADPLGSGKTPAFRKIKPLAPAANPHRFTDSKKGEKWFRRNCEDVFARECTAQEKGDFITWTMQIMP